MSIEFKLPELGENIASGMVTRIMIKVGDTVAVDQPVLEIETDKAVLEIPSSVSGTVAEIRAKEGKSINVGEVVFVASGEGQKAAAVKEPPAPAQKAEAPKTNPPETPLKPAHKPIPAPAPASPVSAAPVSGAPVSGAASRPVLAAPSVRRLARELGVDLSRVAGSGAGGRVSSEDVRAAASATAPISSAEAAGQEPGAEQPAADRDRWGAIERQPMSSIRRKTALHMTLAWETIPHVTHFDSADVTALETFRKRYGKKAETAGAKLTPTVIIAKLVALALKKFPQFNASVDMENETILFKKYVNVGIAVDTPNGLLVPVIRDADQKSIVQMAVEIGQLAEKARARKLTLDEMQGGTFTITNLGGIGGTGFTPIINTPEVAILGLSRSRVEPVYMDGQFAPRTMLPMALSYDHRLIDGADAARFLRWLVEAIEYPMSFMLEE